ncbi:hypothetical protein [Flavobacterium sp. J27]|uniref:hypothetical protein n=1 Tax=Flavobacterium sp. J27 TaxID=2060419 RepID=UPI001031F8EE|nr:hypothetical protein [Flavobacterium sp. J27]
MKNLFLLITIACTLTACQSKKEKETPIIETKDTLTTTITTPEITDTLELFWKGYINQSIPVYLHYQIENEIVVGEIIYLNTKEKKPIKVIGNLNSNGNFRLLEFEPTGNITGIITGNITSENHFKGEWFSPKSRKNFPLDLTVKDTNLIAQNIKANTKEIFGNYSYGYSEAGAQGNFSIEKINENQATFEINCFTSEPARNMAIVDKDTIALPKLSFAYAFPNSEECDFEVQFYKDFVHITYTNGYCTGQFGHNATIEGIFLKTK